MGNSVENISACCGQAELPGKPERPGRQGACAKCELYCQAELPRIILASASPRRKELLEKLGRDFTVEVSEADETIPAFLKAEDTAEYLAGIKADAVFGLHENETVTVIGSDTVVILDGVIYGKPQDRADAVRMLRELSGKTHEVRTGVALRARKADGSIFFKSFTSVTKVSFYELTDDEINAYVSSGEPMDKAGAYGIQGLGALLVSSIDGDYFTVMGLPVAKLYREMKAAGLV